MASTQEIVAFFEELHSDLHDLLGIEEEEEVEDETEE